MSDGIDEAIRDGRIPPDVDMQLLRNNQNIPGIASIACVTFLATLVVVCRLYSRKFIIKGYGFGFDDGVVLASLVSWAPRFKSALGQDINTEYFSSFNLGGIYSLYGIMYTTHCNGRWAKPHVDVLYDGRRNLHANSGP